DRERRLRERREVARRIAGGWRDCAADRHRSRVSSTERGSLPGGRTQQPHKQHDQEKPATLHLSTTLTRSALLAILGHLGARSQPLTTGWWYRGIRGASVGRRGGAKGGGRRA